MPNSRRAFPASGSLAHVEPMAGPLHQDWSNWGISYDTGPQDPNKSGFWPLKIQPLHHYFTSFSEMLPCPFRSFFLGLHGSMFIDQSPNFKKCWLHWVAPSPIPPMTRNGWGFKIFQRITPGCYNPLHGDQEMSFPSDFLWSSKWTPTTPEGDASSRSACIALRS